MGPKITHAGQFVQNKYVPSASPRRANSRNLNAISCSSWGGGGRGKGRWQAVQGCCMLKCMPKRTWTSRVSRPTTYMYARQARAVCTYLSLDPPCGLLPPRGKQRWVRVGKLLEFFSAKKPLGENAVYVVPLGKCPRSVIMVNDNIVARVLLVSYRGGTVTCVCTAFGSLLGRYPYPAVHLPAASNTDRGSYRLLDFISTPN